MDHAGTALDVLRQGLGRLQVGDGAGHSVSGSSDSNGTILATEEKFYMEKEKEMAKEWEREREYEQLSSTGSAVGGAISGDRTGSVVTEIEAEVEVER